MEKSVRINLTYKTEKEFSTHKLTDMSHKTSR